MRLLVVAIACGCSAPPAVPSKPTPKRVDYQAHRGGRGLRSENTLPAFVHALELDVDTLEMDILVTADDVLVVHHDERLNADIARDASGAWLAATGPALRTLTLAELQRYDVGRIKPATLYAARFSEQVGADGVRVPTLEEVVTTAEKLSHGRIRYNLEVKTTPSRPDDTAGPERVAERLVAAVRAWKIDARTTIQSFDFRALRRVRELAPDMPRSCLTSADTVEAGKPGPSPWTAGLDVDSYDSSVPRLVQAAGCTIWSPDAGPLERAQVDEAHRLGLAVLPWTVNDPADMTRLLAWGVDGIITDFPDRLPRR